MDVPEAPRIGADPAKDCAGWSMTVQILDNLFSPNLANLQKAMARTTERHALISRNIANVNTAGYKRQDKDFNILLAEASNPMEEHAKDMLDQKRQIESDLTSLRVDGNNVDMEQETVSLVETELRYEALAQMTQGYFGQLKNVIREGR